MLKTRSTGKGVNPSRLTGIFGCEYLNVAAHSSKNIYAFIVQADTILTELVGGDASIIGSAGFVNVDYLSEMNLSGVTLKQGALITAPEGEVFTDITITTAGAGVIGYK
jgi:hypothetical protein